MDELAKCTRLSRHGHFGKSVRWDPIWVLECCLVASPMHYVDNFGRWQKGPFGLAITSSAVILAKAKSFGGTKVELNIPISQFRRGKFGLMNGSTFYETYSELGSGGGISFLFYEVNSAETVYEYVNLGVAMDQSGFPG